MPKRKLTTAAVERLRPPESGRVDYFDTIMPGLTLRVSQTGRKTWTLFYRLDGKQHRYGLGRFPIVDLAQARERAWEAHRKIERGVNPSAEKQQAREEHRSGAFLYETVAAHFIEEYAKPKNRTWREQQRILDQNAKPVWQGRDIRTLTKQDVREVIKAVESRASKVRANRVLATIRKFCAWAVDEDYLNASPAGEIKLPGTERRRARVLKPDEIRAVWKACEEIGSPFGTAVKMMILTGQRRGEVAQMRWKDIDRDDAAWIIPGEMTKNGESHVVPLTGPAIEIINNQPEIEGNPFVFTTGVDGTKGYLQGWGKTKQRLDTKSGVADWRLHDIRRTVGTNLGRWVGYEVVAAVLNHSRAALMGVTATYNLYEYADEKRRALRAWARQLSRINGHDLRNVVQFREQNR